MSDQTAPSADHPLSAYFGENLPPQQNNPTPREVAPMVEEPVKPQSTGRTKKLLLLSSFFILIVSTFTLSLFFFRNNRQPQPTTRASSPSPIPTSLSQSSGFAGILNSSSSHPELQRFDIEASGNAFKPNSLTAYKNQILVITIRATDQSYDFTLPDYGISKFITSGTSTTVEFQATNFGEYVFFCGAPCNNSDTARGLLTIKP